MNASHDDHAANEPGQENSGLTRLIDIRHLSTEQLAQLGVSQIAYVKQVMMNGSPAFAIHAADGSPMAVAGDQELAVAAIRQHEMVASLVH